MKYKIVVDSCCDLTADMKNWDNFEIVPLTLEIGDYRIFDDENFNQDDFIERMKANLPVLLPTHSKRLMRAITRQFLF